MAVPVTRHARLPAPNSALTQEKHPSRTSYDPPKC